MLGPYMKAFMAQFKDQEKNAECAAKLIEIEAWFTEILNGNNFLGGSELMYFDIHCLTPISQVICLENSVFHQAFEDLKVKENLPNVYAWVHRVRALPLLAPHVMPIKWWHKFLEE